MEDSTGREKEKSTKQTMARGQSDAGIERACSSVLKLINSFHR